MFCFHPFTAGVRIASGNRQKIKGYLGLWGVASRFGLVFVSPAEMRGFFLTCKNSPYLVPYDSTTATNGIPIETV